MIGWFQTPDPQSEEDDSRLDVCDFALWMLLD